ncbi:hypothetical protein M5689_005826 [Euphorbia peplus]|nr:hypothetical protein M5689_005826 [Euphorbia peplus]
MGKKIRAVVLIMWVVTLATIAEANEGVQKPESFNKCYGPCLQECLSLEKGQSYCEMFCDAQCHEKRIVIDADNIDATTPET